MSQGASSTIKFEDVDFLCIDHADLDDAMLTQAVEEIEENSMEGLTQTVVTDDVVKTEEYGTFKLELPPEILNTEERAETDKGRFGNDVTDEEIACR